MKIIHYTIKVVFPLWGTKTLAHFRTKKEALLAVSKIEKHALGKALLRVEETKGAFCDTFTGLE